MHPLLVISSSHSLSIRLSNAFGAAVGTPSDAGCYATICGDVDIKSECSSLGNYAAIQQIIPVGTDFQRRALMASIPREGYHSLLPQLQAAVISDINLIAGGIFTLAVVCSAAAIYNHPAITLNNTCLRGRASTALFLRAVLEIFQSPCFVA